MRIACPNCAPTYGAVGRPSCPFCEGAASVCLAPQASEPVVVARAVQLYVGQYPEYAPVEEMRHKAGRLVDAGILVPPGAEQPDEPDTARRQRTAPDRHRVGRLAGRLLAEKGLRAHNKPKLPAVRPPLRSDGRPDLRLVR